jgi:hypothetical protein
LINTQDGEAPWSVIVFFDLKDSFRVLSIAGEGNGVIQQEKILCPSGAPGMFTKRINQLI